MMVTSCEGCGSVMGLSIPNSIVTSGEIWTGIHSLQVSGAPIDMPEMDICGSLPLVVRVRYLPREPEFEWQITLALRGPA